jgi:hypothetical protein
VKLFLEQINVNEANELERRSVQGTSHQQDDGTNRTSAVNKNVDIDRTFQQQQIRSASC